LQSNKTQDAALSSHRSNAERFEEIFAHLEALVDDHIAHTNQVSTFRECADFAKGTLGHSRLASFCPSLGAFFTRLPLREAFLIQNQKSNMAARRYVAPSFNDIRRILNTAQVKAVAPSIKLITFDGDVTLCDFYWQILIG
jgi:IMP and pyridine-specific 5'-nucleotidase